MCARTSLLLLLLFRHIYDACFIKLGECKGNIVEQFLIERSSFLIEEEMVEEDVRNEEGTGVEMNKIVLFQNKLVDFFNTIETAVKLHREFWTKLLDSTLDIQRI